MTKSRNPDQRENQSLVGDSDKSNQGRLSDTKGASAPDLCRDPQAGGNETNRRPFSESLEEEIDDGGALCT